MSLLSRLFRKTPALSPPKVLTTQTTPAKKSSGASLKPGAADRALTAANEETVLMTAIDARDMQTVARLVGSGSSTRIRQAAAQAIEDPDLLRQLIRDLRGGNDNTAYRILTSKRDALLDQARQIEKRQAELQAASEAIERHSRRVYEPSYASTLDHLVARWEAVAEQADPELSDRVRQGIDRSRELIAERSRLLAAQVEREQAAAHAAMAARREREEQAQASAVAAAEQERILVERKRALADRQQAEQATVREIGKLIRKASDELDEGSVSRATATRRAVEEKLASAPPLPANLLGQIQQLDRLLGEFKDWKSFSVTPKFAELIQEMEALVGAPIDPPVLADQIKRLQEEWRALSKGAGENLKSEWQRFHEAAQKAYQPCSEYFTAQALVREENLRRREALLAVLATFEVEQDWERPDWRALIKTLRDAKQGWRGCEPVDRQAGKAQQERFSALIGRLQDRLEAEYARNLKQKELLIGRAQALLGGDDGRKAVDAVKELQQQWQTVGPVPREADQRLWSEFRRQCDAVFQKRQQDSAAHAAGLGSNKAQAIAICEQLEQIATLEGAALLERAATRLELRKAFEALGEFPRADTRELRNRFDRGLQRCEKAIERQRAFDAEQGWSTLFEVADLVRAYRMAVTRGSSPEQSDSLRQAAEGAIASVQPWPKGGLDAIRQALVAERSTDTAANEVALRTLCLRAEILTDMPTPPEDQALRRDYLLQRLVQNMGQGARSDATQLDAMAIEWIGVGPVEDAIYGPLLQRFRRCRERAGSRAS